MTTVRLASFSIGKVLFLLLWLAPGFQTRSAEFEVVWDSVVGGSGADWARALVRADDGYLFGGSSSSTNGSKSAQLIGYQDFWVIKVDGQGRKIWDRSYGATQAYSDLTSILSIGNGNYLLGGGSASGPWLIQIDENGDVVWQRFLTGTGADRVRQIEPTVEGYFLIAGTMVIRTDLFGRKIWVRSIQPEVRTTSLSTVAATVDGGCLLGLTVYSQLPEFPFGWGFYDYWALKLDADGGDQWQQFYGGDEGDNISIVRTDTAGNFYLLGVSSSGRSGNKTAPGTAGLPFGTWLVKTGPTGSKLWDIELAEGGFTGISSVKVTPDGGCLLAGTVSTIGPRGTVVLGPVIYKVSSEGTHEWTFREQSADSLTSIEFAPDGDLILFGQTGDDLFNGDYRVRKLHVTTAPMGTPRIYLDGQQRSITYSATNQAVLEIKSSIPGAAIHFTLDGSAPTDSSPLYSTPITLTNDVTIRGAIFNIPTLSAGPVELSVFHGYKLLIATNAAGTIRVSPEAAGYFPTNSIEAAAISNPGWSFAQWEGYLSGRVDNPVTFTLTWDSEIGARFTTPLSLETQPAEGSIRPIPNTLSPFYGETIWLTAIPTNGFYFSRWSGTVEGSLNPMVLEVIAPNPAARAEFAPLAENQVSFVAAANGAGKITQSPIGNVFNRGQELTLRASPNSGAAFLGWLGLSNHVETSELKITLEQSTVLIAVFSGGDTSLFGDIVHLSKPEVLTNLFGFQVAANQTNALVVESSTDLKQWRKLTNTGPEIVVERAEYRQFFRARKE